MNISEKLKGRYFDVDVKQEDAPYFFLMAKAVEGEVEGEVMQRGSYRQLVGLFSIHATAVLKVAKKEGKKSGEAHADLLEAVAFASNLVHAGKDKEDQQ